MPAASSYLDGGFFAFSADSAGILQDVAPPQQQHRPRGQQPIVMCAGQAAREHGRMEHSSRRMYGSGMARIGSILCHLHGAGRAGAEPAGPATRRGRNRVGTHVAYNRSRPGRRIVAIGGGLAADKPWVRDQIIAMAASPSPTVLYLGTPSCEFALPACCTNLALRCHLRPPSQPPLG